MAKSSIERPTRLDRPHWRVGDSGESTIGVPATAIPELPARTVAPSAADAACFVGFAGAGPPPVSSSAAAFSPPPRHSVTSRLEPTFARCFSQLGFADDPAPPRAKSSPLLPSAPAPNDERGSPFLDSPCSSAAPSASSSLLSRWSRTDVPWSRIRYPYPVFRERASTARAQRELRVVPESTTATEYVQLASWSTTQHVWKWGLSTFCEHAWLFATAWESRIGSLLSDCELAFCCTGGSLRREGLIWSFLFSLSLQRPTSNLGPQTYPNRHIFVGNVKLPPHFWLRCDWVLTFSFPLLNTASVQLSMAGAERFDASSWIRNQSWFVKSCLDSS